MKYLVLSFMALLGFALNAEASGCGIRQQVATQQQVIVAQAAQGYCGNGAVANVLPAAQGYCGGGAVANFQQLAVAQPLVVGSYYATPQVAFQQQVIGVRAVHGVGFGQRVVVGNRLFGGRRAFVGRGFGFGLRLRIR